MKPADRELLTIGITAFVMLGDVFLTAFVQKQLDVVILIGAVVILLSAVSLRRALRKQENVQKKENQQ